ncbi:MAG TPA: hypothetical protein VK169_15645 [Saprospiraceae bacterium]|nr:hypothetical protein [Saprospiraceae bacterium]
MKNLIIAILFLSFHFLLSSCSKETNCDFLGEWCLDYGIEPCTDPTSGNKIVNELTIESNGDLRFLGTIYKWESTDCKNIQLSIEENLEEMVWIASVKDNKLSIELGLDEPLIFNRQK